MFNFTPINSKNPQKSMKFPVQIINQGKITDLKSKSLKRNHKGKLDENTKSEYQRENH